MIKLELLTKAGYDPAVNEETERFIEINSKDNKALIEAIKRLQKSTNLKKLQVKDGYRLFELIKTNDGIIIYLFVPHKQYKILDD